MRWREGLACPCCGHRRFCELTARKVFQCNHCKKQLSLTAGTVFQDSKLPLTTWFPAIYHLAQSKGGISSIELGRRLGVKHPTAWLIKHKLMRAPTGSPARPGSWRTGLTALPSMAEREAQKPKLAGRIELDDSYLGGERSGGRRGPHAIPDRAGCLMRGRGAAGKTPVVA